MNRLRRIFSPPVQPIIHRIRPFSTQGKNVNIFTAVCIERPAVIAPPLNIIEKTMQQLYMQHEVVKSLHSDHEMRHFEDIARAERLASKQELDERDIEMSKQASAQDFVDASKRELEQTPVGSTISLADKNNDMKSLDRLLDRRLLLLVQQKVGSTFTWLLPSTKFDPEKDGKCILHSAQRVVKELLGDTLQCRFMGNAPCAVYTYKYHSEKQEKKKETISSSDRENAVTFIYKAHLVSGALNMRDLDVSLVKDFAWLSREQLANFWLEKEGKKMQSYFKCLKNTFFREHLDDEQVTKLIAKYTNTRSKASTTAAAASQQRSSTSFA